MNSLAPPLATLEDLLRVAVPYRQWRAPIDPALAHATRLAGAAVGLLAAALLPVAYSTASPIAAAFFALNLLAFAAFLIALVFTSRLEAGARIWHRVCFGVVLVATPQGFVVSLAIVASVVAAILGAIAMVLALLFMLGTLSDSRS